MIRLLTAKIEIPLKMIKNFIPFGVDFKANLTSKENKISKVTIKMGYNFGTPKIKGATIAPS